jgi:cytochrome c biogenesis factor
MALGAWLLLAALAAAGLALGAAVGHARLRAPGMARRATLFTLLAVGLAGLSFLLFLAAFLARDYGVYAVWNYSDDATPLYLRVAGTWAGAAGSVFAWTLALGLGLLVEEAWRARARRAANPEAEGPAPEAARVFALGFFALLLLLTVASQPFAPTREFHLSGQTGFFAHEPCPAAFPDCPTPRDYRPQGFGLNPLLLTPFMAIHPPMELLAYGFTALVSAFGIARLAVSDGRWRGGALFWGRLAWLCYAVALGLGALWAYYVLSFGGYWAWDPVEVGDLIPFLALTVFLHASDMERKGKGYPHYAPLVAALAFPLTLFGTFVTRSSYWISAHAFDVGAAAIVPDPGARLLQVVGGKGQVAMFVALLLGLLAALAALGLVRFVRDVALPRSRLLAWPALAVLAAYLAVMVAAALDVHGLLASGLGLAGLVGRGSALLGVALLGLLLLGVPIALFVWSLEEEPPKEVRAASLLEPDALMSGGVVLLSLGLLVTLALLLIGVNFTVGQLGRFFREREPLIALPVVLVLTMRLSVKHAGKARSAGLALGALAVGVGLYLALPPALRLLGLGVPVLSVALGAALHQMLSSARKSSAASRDAQRAGLLLLLAGIAGFAMWASPPTALPLGFATVRVPLAALPLGLGASMACYLLGIAVAQGERLRLAALGSAAAALAFGYGLSALLGLAALALAWRARPQGTRGVRAALRHHKGRLYGTSRWAGHVGILLLLIGYGASAYHAVEADYHDLADPLERGVPRAFEGYELTLTDSRGADADGDGTFEEVTAFVAVERGGALLDLAPVRFYWVDKESQYRPTEHVVRQPLGDLYLNSNPANLPSLHTPRDGWMTSNQRALFETSAQPRKLASDEVDKLSLSVKSLPLVAPLWAGAALLPFSMAVTIACAPPRGFVKAAKGPAPGLAPPGAELLGDR